MDDLLLQRLQRLFLLCCGLGFAALIGWGSFGYMAWSAWELSHQVSSLNAERNGIIAERNEARANLYQLQQAAGELEQLQAKLSATQAEYSRAVELTDRKAKTTVAEEQLGGLIRRIEKAKDRDSVSQTGTIRKAEPPKRPAP